MRPRLVGFARLRADRVTGVTMLLYPEGAIELSESAEAVVRLCDGVRSVEEIAAVLGEEFEGVVLADVEVVVGDLVGRGLLVG